MKRLTPGSYGSIGLPVWRVSKLPTKVWEGVSSYCASRSWVSISPSLLSVPPGTSTSFFATVLALGAAFGLAFSWTLLQTFAFAIVTIACGYGFP